MEEGDDLIACYTEDDWNEKATQQNASYYYSKVSIRQQYHCQPSSAIATTTTTTTTMHDAYTVVAQKIDRHVEYRRIE